MLTHPEDHVIDYYSHGVSDLHDSGDRRKERQTSLSQEEQRGAPVRWDDASVVGDLSSKKFDALVLHDLCLLIREIHVASSHRLT